MMQKRTRYSLLLTSLLLVCAFSVASAQNTVTFQNTSVVRCEPSALNVTVDPAASVSAFEVVFEVSSSAGGAFFDAVNVVWDPGLTELSTRVIDLGGVDGISPDTVRIAGMLTDAGDVCLAAGPTVVAQVEFTTNDVCAGTVTLAGADFACPSTPVVATTQFVDCASTSLVGATVTAGTVTVVNQNPSIDAIADASLPWGDTYVGQISGDDPDLVSGCEVLSYSKISGPAALTVNATTGKITWTTTGADVCEHVVEVAVVDECGAQATTSFTICVTNEAPQFTCSADTVHIIWGETADGQMVASDPDMGPAALNYSLIGQTGPGAASIDPGTGAWSWPTVEGDNSYIGYFELTFAVTDGANLCDPCSPENADTCVVPVVVIPTIAVTIEKTHGTFQGTYEEVSITFDETIDPPNEMGGFDFLIKYDASALAFQGAAPGNFIDACGWEYFYYSYGSSGSCGAACPSGVLEVVALAETNNGPNHPDCFSSTTFNELVKLNFLVTNDRTFECMYVPVQFVWYQCQDNGIASKSGDTLFISREVYNYGDPLQLITDPTKPFPSIYGAPAVCDVSDKHEPVRLIDFINGGIDIICADSIDDPGDLNLNGLANEIGDATLYSNYFVYGPSALSSDPNEYQAQVAASDVNGDGYPLSVADLVYLLRVVEGNANPVPKLSPVDVTLSNAAGRLAVNGEVAMGAAFLLVAGNVTPTLLAEGMELRYNYDAALQQTRILVWSPNGQSFTGAFVEAPGELVSLELATFEGQPVVYKAIPTDFSLAQNYPNPFNPSTTIQFGLPVASAWTLTIYNVQGQVVETMHGQNEAGEVDVVWEAGMNASGIYFYRLEAGSFTATKKMVLLK